MDQSNLNHQQIKKNRRTIFELEASVLSNKAKSYATRSVIEENRFLILKNYAAAFMGNRQLANGNTEDAFHNRRTILSNIDISGAVQENYCEALINEANLENLDHRSNLNASVLAINELMVKVNNQLIEINKLIMESNEEIANYNSDLLNQNARWLDGALSPDQATPESNAALVSSNTNHCSKILARSEGNSDAINRLYTSTSDNRAAILANSEDIMARRKTILENHNHIVDNQHRIADLISS